MAEEQDLFSSSLGFSMPPFFCMLPTASYHHSAFFSRAGIAADSLAFHPLMHEEKSLVRYNTQTNKEMDVMVPSLVSFLLFEKRILGCCKLEYVVPQI